MPNINGKSYAYTAAGKKAVEKVKKNAAKFKKKKSQKPTGRKKK